MGMSVGIFLIANWWKGPAHCVWFDPYAGGPGLLSIDQQLLGPEYKTGVWSKDLPKKEK